MKYFIIFFLCLSLTVSIIKPAQTITTELRGVWLTNIDSDVLFSEANLRNSISQLAEFNFNTIYPTVWNGGYTLYPSQVSQQIIGQSQDPLKTLQGRDILQEIVQEAHTKAIAVIPWFEFGFMAPFESELANRYPQWLTQRLNGDKIWLEGNVHKRVWLNPLHPEVQQFITDLVIEIINNYNIDGIQFDDHFGFPSDFGYDDFTVKLYQKEHSGKIPPNNSQDQEWINWRANKITNYMQQLFKTIKQSNHQVIVSLSPNPQKFSLDYFLLDWYKWERMGLIEELVLQVYRDKLIDFRRELAQPYVKIAQKHIPVAIGILTGLKGRPVSLDTINKQVKTIREQKFAGVSFFFYESLWNMGKETDKERQSALKSIFINTIKRPTLDQVNK